MNLKVMAIICDFSSLNYLMSEESMILASTVMVRKGIRNRNGDADWLLGVNVYKEKSHKKDKWEKNQDIDLIGSFFLSFLDYPVKYQNRGAVFSPNHVSYQ